MKKLPVFLCSPRADGVTDRLARFYGSAAAQTGAQVKYIPLREYDIIPCQGCMACAKKPWQCLLRKKDQTEELFDILLSADMAIFASPIYFYALPAHFKAFIDRSQKFWAYCQNNHEQAIKKIPSLAIMAAGRPVGEKLFTGATRTLRWFGKSLNLSFVNFFTFRGLDQPGDIQENIVQELAKAGREYPSCDNL